MRDVAADGLAGDLVGLAHLSGFGHTAEDPQLAGISR